MNEATIVNLEESFSRLAPRAAELADRFYTTLFSENPGLRPLFPANMTGPKQKLVAALAAAVRNLRSPGKATTPLVEVSQCAAGRQALNPHAIVRNTLVEAMARMGGEAWNHELDRAWREAIDQVREFSPASPPPRAS